MEQSAVKEEGSFTKKLREMQRINVLDKQKKLKEEVCRRLTIKRQRKDLVAPPRPPRYDKVFFEGLKWFDSL